jgi:hypothetical protein
VCLYVGRSQKLKEVMFVATCTVTYVHMQQPHLSFNFLCFRSGQGELATWVTVCGGKPLWDTYYTMFNRVPKGTLSAAGALSHTRAMQVVFDSL